MILVMVLTRTRFLITPLLSVWFWRSKILIQFQEGLVANTWKNCVFNAKCKKQKLTQLLNTVHVLYMYCWADVAYHISELMLYVSQDI